MWLRVPAFIGRIGMHHAISLFSNTGPGHSGIPTAAATIHHTAIGHVALVPAANAKNIGPNSRYPTLLFSIPGITSKSPVLSDMAQLKTKHYQVSLITA